MTLKLKLNAAARLGARDLGDAPPSSWTQGDIDVTFTPFCKVVRRVLGRTVDGIGASRAQQWMYVYVDQIKSKEIEILDRELKFERIPGNPRFNSIALSSTTSYQGLFVIKYRIY